MNKTIAVLGVVALVLVGVGYWVYTNQSAATTSTNQMGSFNSGENPQPGSQVHDLPVEPAAAKARTDLATKLGASEGSIVIMRVEESTWGDSCLGLGGPAESCLAVLTPGFLVEMEYKGETYFYRTDKTGAQLRIDTTFSAKL